RDLPYYAVIVEQGDIPDRETAHRFLEGLDHRLMSSNFLYSARRRDGVLGPPRLAWIPTGAWDRFVDAEIARKGTDAIQYKHPGIVRDPTWLTRMGPVEIIAPAPLPVRDAQTARV